MRNTILPVLIVGAASVLVLRGRVGAEDAVKPDDVAALKRFSKLFVGICKEVRPAVVQVNAVRKLAVRRDPGPSWSPFRDDILRRFLPPDTYEKWPERRGTGSGVVVDRDGHILTNNHVIQDAQRVYVRLGEKDEILVKVVGADAKTDLAVLQVDRRDVPAARVGDSDKLEVGEWVLAVGNPFGLDQTVTAGIVSAKGRTNLHLADYEDFIQTDAPINPGNSGGPLVNLDGEVVGINTAIVSRSGASAGIGFAIPINLAKNVMESLIRHGKVTRGFLGVYIQDLEPALAEELGLKGTDGVVVSEVFDDSPAKKAGVEPGDVILEFDGEAMKNVSQLRNRVAATPVGSAKELVVWRKGKEVSLAIKLGEQTPEMTERSPQGTETGEVGYGLTVQKVTPSLAEQFGHDRGTEGLVITEVEPGSPAAREGLKPGDVITAAGPKQEPVRSSEDLRSAGAKVPAGRGLLLRVKSPQGARFVVLKKETEEK